MLPLERTGTEQSLQNDGSDVSWSHASFAPLVCRSKDRQLELSRWCFFFCNVHGMLGRATRSINSESAQVGLLACAHPK